MLKAPAVHPRRPKRLLNYDLQQLNFPRQRYMMILCCEPTWKYSFRTQVGQCGRAIRFYNTYMKSVTLISWVYRGVISLVEARLGFTRKSVT